MKRCAWVDEKDSLMVSYHDAEWGVPTYDDRTLFEFLVLEGAQAGLSWKTILQRRAMYRKAFLEFDVLKIAQMTDAGLEGVLQESGVIRHRLKVWSVRKNAKVFIDVQKEYGTFSDYLWQFVDHKPIKNKRSPKEVLPAFSDTSTAISLDLKRRGMIFVGPTIIYAYMQAVGLVDDHSTDCFCAKKP